MSSNTVAPTIWLWVGCLLFWVSGVGFGCWLQLSEARSVPRAIAIGDLWSQGEARLGRWIVDNHSTMRASIGELHSYTKSRVFVCIGTTGSSEVACVLGLEGLGDTGLEDVRVRFVAEGLWVSLPSRVPGATTYGGSSSGVTQPGFLVSREFLRGRIMSGLFRGGPSGFSWVQEPPASSPDPDRRNAGTWYLIGGMISFVIAMLAVVSQKGSVVAKQ